MAEERPDRKSLFVFLAVASVHEMRLEKADIAGTWYEAETEPSSRSTLVWLWEEFCGYKPRIMHPGRRHQKVRGTKSGL
jgi:hypothetical protein